MAIDNNAVDLHRSIDKLMETSLVVSGLTVRKIVQNMEYLSEKFTIQHNACYSTGKM